MKLSGFGNGNAAGDVRANNRIEEHALHKDGLRDFNSI